MEPYRRPGRAVSFIVTARAGELATSPGLWSRQFPGATREELPLAAAQVKEKPPDGFETVRRVNFV
jgi:hypothetical protein